LWILLNRRGIRCVLAIAWAIANLDQYPKARRREIRFVVKRGIVLDAGAVGWFSAKSTIS
jgi:hypothetical protein